MRKIILAMAAAMTCVAAANADVIYFSDFDTNDGGWVASATWDPVGDWAWTDAYDGANYTGGYVAPAAAYSGAGLWGTVLYGDYTNAGGESFLRQTFDFTGYTDLELNFMAFVNAFYEWDTAKAYVNGQQVWDYGFYNANPTWEAQTVDLSAWDGQAGVEITFELHASTVVERAGFYLDDVEITGIPTPASLALLALAGLAGRRRR